MLADMRRGLAGALVVVLFCATAIGEETPGKAEECVEIIEVVATPIVQGTLVSRYGDSVVIVGGEQISAQNASDLATALSRVPGVTFSRHNLVGAYGGGDGGAIYIRGHGSGRPGANIGTLVDGIPKFSGVWTHPLLDMLPIDAANAIEVYKSTQPVLLGNMSFGAVNMVPKRMTQEGSEGRVLFGFGSYNTLTGILEHGTKTGPYDWYFVGSHRNSDGHREDAGGIVDYFYGRAGYDINTIWHMSLQLHHSNSTVEDPEALGTPAFFWPERFITRDEKSILTFENKSEKTSGHIKFYHDKGLQNWEQWNDNGTPGDLTDDEPFASVTNYRNYGVRARQVFALSPRSEIVVGVDHDVSGGHFIEEHPSVGLLETDERVRNTAPYLLLSSAYGMDWDVIPSTGVRWNNNDTFGDEMGWQAGLRASRDNLTIHTHFAHSFNYPGVYTAVMFGGTGFGTLEPEIIDHLEIGFEYKSSQVVKYNLVFYRDEVDNGIKVVAPPPHYENVGT
ncbi:MAG TPA: TonB-dependent receptor, partial [Planctomycetes bacterium]|nr:TonB-dependent receptor [Planctomycetota bacterium]